ncbi:MAG: autotransporter-associated beta strand repeat-containing protein, partial [Thermoguttaceae bacterium]|nr:autotransporter-associated beta strand repeat-containing protein [Thermoguttaceae bacterium]
MHRPMYRWIRRRVLLATSSVPTARMVAILLVAAAACLLAAPLPAWTQTTYTWNYDGGSGTGWPTNNAWSSSANWTPTGYPNASDHIAKFTLALSAHRTITMSENITINQLTSTNTGSLVHRLEIGSSSYTLTFAGTNPTINVSHASGGDAGVWINALVDVGTVGVKSVGSGWNTVRFASGVQGSGTITVDTNSGIELTGNSPNFSGDFVVNSGGLLQARTTQANVLGNTTGKTIINQGGQFFFRDMGSSPAIPEPFELKGVHSRGSIQAYASNPTMNGPVTLSANGSFSVRDWASGEPGNTRTFTINSVIDDGPNTYSVFFLNDYTDNRWANARNNVIVLGAQSTYGGNTYITTNYHDATNPFTGRVRLAVNNALPTTTKVILGGRHDAGGGVYIGVTEGNGTLILNGFNQTLAGLETAGTGTINRVVGGSTTTSILTLNIADTVTNTYGGFLGGSGTDENNLALVKTGLGTLVLSAANTYTGTTTVSQGVLRITTASALGASGSGQGTTVADGAALEVSGNLTVSEPITLTGNGPGGKGALYSTGTSATWDGPITLSGLRGRIGVATNGTFTISGGISGSSIASFGGGANGTIEVTTKPINITRKVEIVDNTTLLLKVTGNNWTDTDIGGGTTLELGVSDAMPSGTVVTLGSGSSSGVLRLNGFNQQLAGLQTSGTGTGNRVVGGSTTPSTLTLNIADTVTNTYGGFLGGTGTNENNLALVKSGLGTLILSAANTYAGTTTVQAGTLQLGHNNALGSTAAGTTVQTGATLEINGFNTPEPITLNGGTLSNNSSTAGYVTGTLTLTANSTIFAANNALYLQGQVTGSGGFTKTGGHAVRLSNTANNYTGPTVINAGYLDNEASEVIPDGSPMTVNAYWNLRGNTETIHSLSGSSGGYIYSSIGTGILRIGAGNVDATYNGLLKVHSGVLSIEKIGTGTQTLSGSNDYTGTTTVSQGVLRIT